MKKTVKEVHTISNGIRKTKLPRPRFNCDVILWGCRLLAVYVGNTGRVVLEFDGEQFREAKIEELPEWIQKKIEE